MNAEDKLKNYYDKLSEIFSEMIKDGIEPSIVSESKNGVTQDYGIQLETIDDKMITLEIYLSMKWF